jgi:hypothetical protein
VGPKDTTRPPAVAYRTLFWTPIQGTVAGIGALGLFACELVELGLIAVLPGWCAGTLPIFPRATKDVGTATRVIRTAPPAALRHSALARSASSISHDSVDGAKAIPKTTIACTRTRRHVGATPATDRARNTPPGSRLIAPVPAMHPGRWTFVRYEIRDPFR